MANIVFDGELSDYMRLVSMYYGNSYGHSYETESIDTYEEYVNQLTKSKNKRYIAFSNEVFDGKDFYSSEIHSFEPSDIEEIEKYVTDGKINIDKLNSGEEIILFAPQKIGYRFEPYENGDGFSGGVIDISDSIKEARSKTTKYICISCSRRKALNAEIAICSALSFGKP